MRQKYDHKIVVFIALLHLKVNQATKDLKKKRFFFFNTFSTLNCP